MKIKKIFILAGIAESKKLIDLLRKFYPDLQIMASLAGLSAAKQQKNFYGDGVDLHIGGFGGAAGLKDFLLQQKFEGVIDATHPYAINIKENSFLAATQVNLFYISYLRPAWDLSNLLQVQRFHTMEEVGCDIAPGSCVFWAAGRHIPNHLYHRRDITLVVRVIYPPEPAQHNNHRYIQFKPDQSRNLFDEVNLFKQYCVTHLITKDSGGEQGFYKLQAAQHLNIKIYIQHRPNFSCGLQQHQVDDITKIVQSIQ